MSLEEITKYLIRTRPLVPVLRDISPHFIGDEPPKEAACVIIDVGAYALDVFELVAKLQREKTALKDTLKSLAENDFNIHWHRASKRAILEKFFPDLIPTTPYYAGGDLILDAEK